MSIPAAATGREQRLATIDPGQVLRALAGLRSACVLYPDEHPAIEAQVDDVLRFATKLLGDEEVAHLDIIRGILNFDGEPLQHESRVHQRVLEEFTSLGLDSIHISRGLTRREIHTVGRFIAREHGGPGTGPPLMEELAARGVSHLDLGRILPVSQRAHGLIWPEAPEEFADPDYRDAADRVHKTFDALEHGLAPDMGEIHDVLEILIGRVARSGVALSQVMALKQYENLSYLHSVNVALLSVRLGERLNLKERDLMIVAEAALLHDVGKTRVPVEILRKPGRPTEREWRQIRRHPLVGAEMLSDLEGLSPLTPVVALEHHRDFEGGGYPDLGPERTPHPLSQLVAVADVYESVTGARSYREPATPEQACLILARMAGDKLNPALVKAFVSVVTFFPAGSIVRTTMGELALVTSTNDDDALHPWVAMLDADRPAATPGPIIDLRERDGGGAFVRDVAEAVQAKQHGFDVAELLRRAGFDRRQRAP